MNIHDFLIESGIFPNLNGFHYLIKAVEIVKKKPKMQATKELYPAVGKAFKVSSTSVERSIRNIVVGKLKYKDFEKIGIHKRPTNTELIWFFAIGGKK